MAVEAKRVAVLRRTYLARSEVFIYNELKYSQRYDKIVLTTRLENLDIFPWPRVYLPADLRRFSPRWLADRLARTFSRRELYLENVCRREKVRLLHPHFGYDAVWTLPLKRATRLPMVTTFYGADTYNPENIRLLRDDYARLFAEGERFIARGSRMVERLASLGCRRERMRVVHLCVDPEEYRFSPRPPVEEKLVLLFCARLIEVKGLRYVLEALPLLAERGVPFELRVIGFADPPDMDYPALADRLGVADRVTFLGYQPPGVVRDEMSRAHLFLQPSVTTRDGIIEGSHPTTLVEAQAVGCPVIGTHHSDIPEVVADGKTGWLVEEKRPEQIGDRIEWFMEHPGVLEEFGRNARKHIEEHYNARKEMAKLEGIYDELLGPVARQDRARRGPSRLVRLGSAHVGEVSPVRSRTGLMDLWPRVTVVSPVFNAERVLCRLVTSLRAQSYPRDRTEIVLVDNGSIDRSWEMIRSWPDVVALRETRLRTPGAPRNLGMQKASGEVIALIDADCWAHPDWLRRGVGMLLEQDLDRVAGRVQFVAGPHPNIYEVFDAAVNFRQRDFVNQRWSGSGNLFIRREVLEDIGLFDPTLRSGMDYEFGVRASDKGETLGFCAAAVVYHETRRSFKSQFKKFLRTGYGVGQLHRKYGYFAASAFFRKANYRPLFGTWRDFPEADRLSPRAKFQVDLLWNALRMASNLGNFAGHFDLLRFQRKARDA